MNFNAAGDGGATERGRNQPWRRGGWLTLGLMGIGGALFFYWQSLADSSAPARAPIPTAELIPAGAAAVRWRLPAIWRSSRWHRVGVRVLENGQALPLRVEPETSVTELGRGRFCAQEEWLYFSATDDTNPASNGRAYQFEIRRPFRWPPIAAAGLFVLTVGAWLARRSWLRRRNAKPEAVFAQAEGSARVWWRAGIVCLGLAGLLLTQAWPAMTLSRRVTIPPEAMVQHAEGHFFYYEARWIRVSARAEAARMFEGGQLLSRVTPPAAKTTVARGSYGLEEDHVCFRASDDSNPSLNGRAYTLRAPIIPSAEAFRLAWPAALVGLGLLAWAPGLAASLRGLPKLNAGWWWASMVGIGLLKLWWVAGAEVSAADADALGYAGSASTLAWLGGSGGLPTHPSGFPLVAGITAQFGVPWRLFLELLYLTVCSTLALVTASLVGSRAIAVCLFLTMAWHPWTFSGFNDFMPYPMVLVLHVALLASMFAVLGRPSACWRGRVFVGIGALLFLWEWSRVEEPLVYGTYALFAALAWVLTRREEQPAALRQRIFLLAVPVAVVFLLGTGARELNHHYFGIYAKSRISAPGLMALMKALYRINPERELRYAPVTRQSLLAACDASPTLAAGQQKLMDPQALATRNGEGFTGVPGEFGPWLNWLLPSAFPSNGREANEAMLKAAGEINQALASGRLPRRRAFFPLDPSWHLWLPDLWPCFLRSLESGAALGHSIGWPPSHQPEIEHLFDEAANRRALGAYPLLLLGEGWVRSPAGALDSVAVVDQRGRLLGGSPLTSNLLAGAQGFHIHVALEERPAAFGLLFLREGKVRCFDQGQHGSSWTNSIVLPDTGEQIAYGSDFSVSEPRSRTRLAFWEGRMESLLRWLLPGLLLLTGWFAGWRRAWEKAGLRRIFGCLLLASGCWIARAAFYALIEANVAWGAERYLRCVSPVFILVLFLAAMLAGGILRFSRGKR